MPKDLAKSARATEQWAKTREKRNSRWIVDSFGRVHILMTRGLEAIIDTSERDKASRYTWIPRFSHIRKSDGLTSYYAEASIPGDDRHSIFLHNLIMEPKDGLGVDHIDRNGLNCTRENMRYCTANQNASNRTHTRNVRPYRGVYQNKNNPAWFAKLMIKGKYIYRGGFKTAKEAALAYNVLATEHYGDFATLNVIEDDEKVA